MALFRFRMRNSERDRETDTGRLQRLYQSLADIRAGAAMSSRSDDMTGTMIRYTKRLAALQAQIDFVTEIDRRVEAFSQGTQGIEPLPSVKRQSRPYGPLQKFTGLVRHGHISTRIDREIAASSFRALRVPAIGGAAVSKLPMQPACR